MPPPLRAAAALGLAYRPMTDDDLAFAAALYGSTRAEEVAQAGWPEDLQRAFLAQQFEAQHSHYRRHYPDAEWLILERGGERIGRFYVEEWPSQFRVIDIIVAAESRGLGIGAAIFADLFELARSKGKKVSIHIEKNNPARSLYIRLGFEVVEDKGVYDLMEWTPAETPS